MNRCMKAYLLGIAFVVGIVVPGISQGEGDADGPDPEIRRATIEKVAARLRTFVPAEDTPRAELTLDEDSDYRAASYVIRGEGLVETSDGGWVYISTLSSHKDPQSGNLILAIDGSGRLFENDGHVCGEETLFESIESRAAADPDDFFARFIADLGGNHWERFTD